MLLKCRNRSIVAKVQWGLFTAVLGALLVAAMGFTPTLPSATAVSKGDPKLSPTATLTILTTTIGGVGRFAYIAGPYDDDPTEVFAITRRSGVQAEARPEGNLELLSTNRYVIQQLPFPKADGHWALARVVCNGARLKVRQEPISHFRYVQLRLTFGRPTVCSFVSRFIRARGSAPR
jgi:hypothetical protein